MPLTGLLLGTKVLRFTGNAFLGRILFVDVLHFPRVASFGRVAVLEVGSLEGVRSTEGPSLLEALCTVLEIRFVADRVLMRVTDVDTKFVHFGAGVVEIQGEEWCSEDVLDTVEVLQGVASESAGSEVNCPILVEMDTAGLTGEAELVDETASEVQTERETLGEILVRESDEASDGVRMTDSAEVTHSRETMGVSMEKFLCFSETQRLLQVLRDLPLRDEVIAGNGSALSTSVAKDGCSFSSWCFLSLAEVTVFLGVNDTLV